MNKDSHISIPIVDIELLLGLVPDWANTVPKGLDATFYGTLTYEGDLKIKRRVNLIRDQINSKVR